MRYYFVDWEGELTSEDTARGWFEVDNKDVFTVRRKAVVQARKRIKVRIAELKAYSEYIGTKDARNEHPD